MPSGVHVPSAPHGEEIVGQRPPPPSRLHCIGGGIGRTFGDEYQRDTPGAHTLALRRRRTPDMLTAGVAQSSCGVVPSEGTVGQRSKHGFRRNKWDETAHQLGLIPCHRLDRLLLLKTPRGFQRCPTQDDRSATDRAQADVGTAERASRCATGSWGGGRVYERPLQSDLARFPPQQRLHRRSRTQSGH